MWLVKDHRGLMLFVGAKPEKYNGIYISVHPPIAKIPADALDFKVTDPVNVKIVPSE